MERRNPLVEKLRENSFIYIFKCKSSVIPGIFHSYGHTKNLPKKKNEISPAISIQNFLSDRNFFYLPKLMMIFQTANQIHTPRGKFLKFCLKISEFCAVNIFKKKFKLMLTNARRLKLRTRSSSDSPFM